MAILGGLCGTLTVSNSTFSDNDADYGGAIFNRRGVVIVDGSTVSQNFAVRTGGGIYNNSGTLTISRSSLRANIAGQYGGGGIGSVYGSVVVSDSTFSGNSARADGGGGIYGTYNTETVRSSTFSGNSAKHGGAIRHGAPGSLTVSNSTFYGNNADQGGGLYGQSGTLTVSYSTFSSNSATSAGGGLYSNPTDAVTLLSNTIVANSTVGGNCAGAISDGGSNLSYPDTTCPGIHSDPKLGLLQDNGGLTWTMLPLPGSAALDVGDDAICAAPPVNGLDQRGVTRPRGLHCDIGAVEKVPIRILWLPALLSR